MIAREDWTWYGNAGHFICGHWCRFHLCTKVGPWLVSTVGQYWPERPVWEIHARVHDPVWLRANAHRKSDDFDHAYMQRFGFEEIGYNRTFETMVFKAGPPCTADGCECGQPTLESGMELDAAPANTAGEATRNHLRLCEEWAQKESA